MQFTLFGKTVHVDDGLVQRYSGPVPATPDEIEGIAQSCRFTKDTPAEIMEEKLAEAIEESIDMREATPTIIKEAKKTSNTSNIRTRRLWSSLRMGRPSSARTSTARRTVRSERPST